MPPMLEICCRPDLRGSKIAPGFAESKGNPNSSCDRHVAVSVCEPRRFRRCLDGGERSGMSPVKLSSSKPSESKDVTP